MKVTKLSDIPPGYTTTEYVHIDVHNLDKYVIFLNGLSVNIAIEASSICGWVKCIVLDYEGIPLVVVDEYTGKSTIATCILRGDVKIVELKYEYNGEYK